VLFVIGVAADPVARLPSGSHAAGVQTNITIWCFILGAAYVPAMISLRVALWAFRGRRNSGE
jgi:hypothetical protein